MVMGSKSFCPECESEIVSVQPVEIVPVAEQAKPAAVSGPVPEASQSAHVIKDGMGMIEENRTKIGAVETFSDNSVTNHTHTTNTTNISNITKIEDDTKKSVVCEISGRKVLLTSSVVCPVCGKTVAEQYYDEVKLRCSLCEKKAVQAYEAFYKEITAGSRVIDQELRSVLDAKAKSFKLTDEQVKESELKLRKTQSDKQERLSDIQQKDFDRTIKQLKEGKIAASACLSKVSAYARLTDDPVVQCWYWLLFAVVSPENYLQDMKAATVDCYWQIYWAFVAAMKAKNTTEAVLCVDRAKTKYPDSINDITLAQAFLEVFQYVDTKDGAYLDDADNDMGCVVETESRCLQEFRERLKDVLAARSSIPSIEKMLLARPVDASQKPQHPQSEKPQHPQSPQSQKAANPAPQKPAAQQDSKGYTLNSAGGPINPTMTSFPQAHQQEKKTKGSVVAIVIAVVLALGAYIFLTKDSEEKVSEPAATSVEKPVEKAVKKPAEKAVEKPAEKQVEKTEQTPVKEVAAEPVPAKEETKPATMAQKAAASASHSAAVSQSDALAQGMEAYKNGNYKEAHDLFKKEAAAGNAEACYQLGLMLSTGKGTIAKNPLQAKVWLKKAAGLGHADAQKVLETL